MFLLGFWCGVAMGFMLGALMAKEVEE